jgi:hypothetical protein
MFRFTRYIPALLTVIALIFIAIPGNALARDSSTLATGLTDPTIEQSAWMKQNFPVIQKIRLNAMALDRINIERQAKGLSRLSMSSLDIAPTGEEAIFKASTNGDFLPAVDMINALPTSVDNSLLPAFPPIRSQGGIGSCAAWATTYYQFTHETNLALNRTASSGDNTNIFSPKWTYNMINGGVDGGSYFSDAYNLEFKNGAATWADFPYDTNYLAWDTNPSHWNTAMNYRVQSSGSIYNSNIDTMIGSIKTNLAGGHVMVIGTYVNSWVRTTISDDPATTSDDPFKGQAIASYERNTRQGGHGMTIVGYNDTLWCDLNLNSTVDSGEKGAFKIANSWGTGDWNGGYRWITYDSLRTVSATPTTSLWPSTDRASGGIFFSGTVYTLTVSPSSYNPTFKAEVTLNQSKRKQIAVTLGLGSTSSTTPTSTWTSKAVYNTGGDYAFDGSAVPLDGTFYFDFSDLAKSTSGTNRWFVGIKDSTTGDITTIKSFKLFQGDVLVASASGLPKTIDAGQSYVWVDYAPNSNNQLPVANLTASPLSGNSPLNVSFSGSGSDPDGYITGYSWNFGDGSSASGQNVNHTYSSAGSYNANMTVTDNKGAMGIAAVVISVTDPIVLKTPTRLTASVRQRLVTLKWTDNSANEAGFLIERRLGSGSYVQIGSTSKDVRTFVDSTVGRGTYYYRVRAFNGTTLSSYSNSVRAYVR